jgi:hypothetical protein
MKKQTLATLKRPKISQLKIKVYGHGPHSVHPAEKKAGNELNESIEIGNHQNIIQK